MDDFPRPIEWQCDESGDVCVHRSGDERYWIMRNDASEWTAAHLWDVGMGAETKYFNGVLDAMSEFRHYIKPSMSDNQ